MKRITEDVTLQLLMFNLPFFLTPVCLGTLHLVFDNEV